MFSLFCYGPVPIRQNMVSWPFWTGSVMRGYCGRSGIIFVGLRLLCSHISVDMLLIIVHRCLQELGGQNGRQVISKKMVSNVWCSNLNELWESWTSSSEKDTHCSYMLVYEVSGSRKKIFLVSHGPSLACSIVERTTHAARIAFRWCLIVQIRDKFEKERFWRLCLGHWVWGQTRLGPGPLGPGPSA